jgi:hypothetical protein
VTIVQCSPTGLCHSLRIEARTCGIQSASLPVSLDFMTNVGPAPDNSLHSKLKSGDISFWDDLRTATDAAKSFSEILALSTLRRRALHLNLAPIRSRSNWRCWAAIPRTR